MRKHITFFLILMFLVICGVSAASAKGFKVQLMEEGTEYTQFAGGWPWDIQPFNIPFQQADDRVICGAWVPKATPIRQDCILAAVERGDKMLLVGGVKNRQRLEKEHSFRLLFQRESGFLHCRTQIGESG